jgi:hypothetical protein
LHRLLSFSLVRSLFPPLLPLPQSGGHIGRQPVAELSRQHAQLAAMVRFVRHEVA